MTEIEFIVLATSIVQEISEDYQVPFRTGPVDIRLPRTQTTLKMAAFVDGEVLEYEAQIPVVAITKRRATVEEFELARDLKEVERRHQERMERRLGRWPR